LNYGRYRPVALSQIGVFVDGENYAFGFCTFKYIFCLQFIRNQSFFVFEISVIL